MKGALADRLVPWYREHRRDLPFRRTKDPYAILVAEFVLQRTRIVSGLPYFERFLARFPTVADLAGASEGDVLKAWEGLGFYGRARNLHRAAKEMTSRHGGQVPGTFAELQELPGIGDYTAGAVASIAFGERVPAVDGNAVRVLARVFRLTGDVARGDTRRRLVGIASSLVPASDPGTFNQALMELGATVCTPRSPRCAECPLRGLCGGFLEGRPERYPEVRRRSGVSRADVAFALAVRGGRVLLVRRPAGGLLAGLWAFPGGEIPLGTSRSAFLTEALHDLGVGARLGGVAGHIEHVFSHRRWSGDVVRARVLASHRLGEDAIWAEPRDLRRLPLVTFHRRLLERIPATAREASSPR